MTDFIATLVPALGAALLAFLWQGALIGGIAALLLQLARASRPQVRYAIAAAALLACAFAPAWSVLNTLTTAAPSPTSAPVPHIATVGDAGATASWPASFGDTVLDNELVLPWVVTLWALGVLLVSLRLARGIVWVSGLRRASRPCPDTQCQVRLETVAERMGLRRAVALRVIDDGDTPLCAGVLRPTVFIPAAMLLRMPTDVLEALLAHELAHVRRHDYLVNLLQGVAETLLFYHPVVWWLSRRMRDERELVADDIAVRVLGAPRQLAEALVELDRYSLALPTVAQAATGGKLLRRVEALIRPQHRPVGGRLAFPLLGVVAGMLTWYAHGEVRTTAKTVRPAPVVEAVAPTPPVAPVAPVTPPARVAPAVPAAPVSPTAPVAPAAPIAADARTIQREFQTYALVGGARGDSLSLSGELDDVAHIRAAQKQIPGEFVWFRRGRSTHVLRDPKLVEQIKSEWRVTDELEPTLQALDAEMRPHSEKVDALSAELEALVADNENASAARDADAEIERLAEEKRELAQQQQQLAERMREQSAEKRAASTRELEALASQQEKLDEELQGLMPKLAAANARREANEQLMETLSRQIEAAAAPMEAISERIEVVAKHQEERVAQADRAIQQLLREAMQRGLTTAAP